MDKRKWKKTNNKRPNENQKTRAIKYSKSGKKNRKNKNEKHQREGSEPSQNQTECCKNNLFLAVVITT